MQDMQETLTITCKTGLHKQKQKNCKNFISGLQCSEFHNIIKFSFNWVKLLYWRWSYQDLMIKNIDDDRYETTVKKKYLKGHPCIWK